MATLVLTVLGSALGGPVGDAIGALAGQALDAQIFKPKGRTGPRLTDLNVQTSRYGAQIPRIFGRMRVAGTVIWATDLRESSSTSGGKGKPSTTSFSYSASFAVALSSRRIMGIGRIWADGNLLRGAAGDFKTPLGALRIYDGAAGQAVDPLIAAAVGLEQAPTFGGLAYVVLEDLQLADFGNRIPSLTMEVIADDDAVTVSGIASDLLGQNVDFLGAEAPGVLGYAADGSDIGDALAPLVESYGLRWRFDAGGMALVESVETGRTLAAADELRAVDGREERSSETQRAPLDDVAARLSVRHFDPERDYQLGMQSAERPGPGRRIEEIGLPAAISADTARRLADRSLRTRLAGRRRMERACGWAALDLKAGDLVGVEGAAGTWIVDTLEWHDMAPRLSLRGAASTASLPATGDSGQPVLPPDLVQGATRLALVELPPPEDSLAQAPLVFAAATGATVGWRRAALFRYRAETGVAEPAGSTAPRAVLGTALTTLAPGFPWTFDALSTVDIALDHPSDSLIGAADDELMRGANLCALGDELLQFGDSTLIGPGQVRLSRLVRGWHGTEWAMERHITGDRFVLLEPSRLRSLATTPGDVGQMTEMRASGSGDTVPAEAALSIDGRAILPPSPVQGVMHEAGGDLHLAWTRRSRLGWLWRDLADAPLAEEREAYTIAVTAGGVILRDAETLSANWIYAAADRADDLAAAGSEPIMLLVRQIGTFGPSRPLAFALS